MNNLYQLIQQNIQCLPKKDEELCDNFLKNRELDKVQEIAESCLIMKKRSNYKNLSENKWKNVDIDQLEKLVLYVREYNSYLNIYDFSND